MKFLWNVYYSIFFIYFSSVIRMPRLPKKVEKGPLHNRETLIKDVANRSLTVEHCEFFLKKYGSNKLFDKYISKYYPQNGGCSFHIDSKNRVSMLPSIKGESKSLEKECRFDISRSLHHKKSRSKLYQPTELRYRKGESFQFFGFKLNEIIKKTKTEQ